MDNDRGQVLLEETRRDEDEGSDDGAANRDLKCGTPVRAKASKEDAQRHGVGSELQKAVGHRQ